MADITYFQGAELQDFAAYSGAVHNSTAGFYKAANARCAIQCASGAEDANFIDTTSFSADDFWSHFVASWASNAFQNMQRNFAKWYAGGVNRIALWQSAANSDRLEARKWNGAAWESIGISGPLGLLLSTTYTFDVYIKLGNPGSIRVYMDRVPIIAVDDANLTFPSVIALDKFRLSTSTVQAAASARYSEVIVANWNTLGSKLVSRAPAANGYYSEWAGLGHTALSEITPAATYMTSGAANQRISVAMAAFPALAAGERIERVKVAANKLRDASGPQKSNIFYRVAGTDDDRADRALTVSAADYTEAWDASPATGTYWTPTELNASEPGVRSRA